MAKRRKKSVEPHFTLPGDEKRVQALAYAHGVHCVPTVAFMAAKEGELLPARTSMGEGYLVRVPKEEDIPQVAQQMADMFISGLDDEPPTTNAPVLFRECFVETYMEGYRFGLFSIHHGMLDLLAGLPDDRHHDVIYRFAWEKIMQESVYEGESDAEPDILMDNGVEAIKAIYKQYQALN